jgi:hypothetical protein
MAVGGLPIRQQAREPAVAAGADLCIHTKVAQDIQDKDMKAVQEYGKDLAKLGVAVAVDLLAPDKVVTDLLAEQADPELLYWDLV